MRALLVCCDMAPSIAFSMLQECLVNKNIQVYSLIGSGRPFNYPLKQIDKLAKESDVVLTGMSAFEAQSTDEEMVATIAFSRKIPFGFYADTYDVYKRPLFKKLISENSFLFVIDENEKLEAKEFCLTAEVVVSGNPTWEDFFFPRFSRKEIREYLNVRNEKVILCPLDTNLDLSLEKLEALKNALSDNKRESWMVVCTKVYVNAPPHIGYAFELTQADAIARYFRQSGKEVYFLTGTDEHGATHLC